MWKKPSQVLNASTWELTTENEWLQSNRYQWVIYNTPFPCFLFICLDEGKKMLSFIITSTIFGTIPYPLSLITLSSSFLTCLTHLICMLSGVLTSYINILFVSQDKKRAKHSISLSVSIKYSKTTKSNNKEVSIRGAPFSWRSIGLYRFGVLLVLICDEYMGKFWLRAGWSSRGNRKCKSLWRIYFFCFCKAKIRCRC